MKTLTVCGILCSLFLGAFAQNETTILPDTTTTSTTTTPNPVPEYQITIEQTNMPVVWQVDAAELLREAFELETNSYTRLQLFTTLFSTQHRELSWLSVLNYGEFFYTAQYNIHLKINNDQVILISTPHNIM